MMDILAITRSKVRQELLALFFGNPAQGYFQRELARRLNRSIGNIRREVIQLERDGLLLRTNTANLVFFHLNKAYPLYKEIEGIVLKTIGITPTLRTALGKLKGIGFSFIYGSYADQVANPKMAKRSGHQWNGKSDIDIFIIGKPPITGLNQLINSLEKRFSREINYSVYGKKEFIHKLRQKNSFILNIISKPIIPLKGFVERSSKSYLLLDGVDKWRVFLNGVKDEK